MSRPRKPVPSFRLHKPSGQAVVTIAGRDYYLGPYDDAGSWQKYLRLIQEWKTTGTIADEPAEQFTVDDLIAKYWEYAERYYRKNGEPTGEQQKIRYAMQPLHEMYGDEEAHSFGARKLKLVRERMIESGLSRKVINQRIMIIKRAFRWAASEELVPESVFQTLWTVSGLAKNRSAARETLPVEPVDDATFEATLPHLPAIIADIARFQRLTGCRPSEALEIRPADIDRTTSPWCYRPARHKTEHMDLVRVIFIGPQAQAILTSYLERDAEAHCFSPADSEAKRKAVLRQARRSKVQPSQRDRSKPAPQRKPGRRYSRSSYLNAIRRACRKANVPLWSPNRLRHAAATAICRRFDLEASRVVLGHTKTDTTNIYVAKDLERARQIMLEIG